MLFGGFRILKKTKIKQKEGVYVTDLPWCSQSYHNLSIFPLVAVIAIDSPASPEVATVSAEIMALADPTCTNVEKTLLEALEAALETAHADMGKALEEAQQTLNGNIIV